MNRSSKRVILVCDASLSIGSGHVMRQITLAVSLLAQGLSPVLYCYEISDYLIIRAESFGIPVVKRTEPAGSAKLGSEISSLVSDAVVFDGYEFDLETIADVYNSGKRIILIDDNGELSGFPCHLIINQNLHANTEMYAKNTTRPELLLGLQWTMIRPEVTKASKKSLRTHFRREGLLISMGGTDHLGLTPLLVQGLRTITDEQFVTTSGVLNPNGFSPDEMAQTMATSRLGVLACGTTTWEAICLQLPFIGIITAKNQEMVGASLVAYEIAPVFDCRKEIELAEILLSTRYLLSQGHKPQSKKFPSIDGLGAQRCAVAIGRCLTE